MSPSNGVRPERDAACMTGDDDWGTRLADVRVPSWYPLGLLVLSLATVYRTFRDRRVISQTEASFKEAGELLAERLTEGDKRDERIAELTKRMERYGRTSVRLATASLIVATVALVVAVVVAVAG